MRGLECWRSRTNTGRRGQKTALSLRHSTTPWTATHEKATKTLFIQSTHTNKTSYLLFLIPEPHNWKVQVQKPSTGTPRLITVRPFVKLDAVLNLHRSNSARMSRLGAKRRKWKVGVGRPDKPASLFSTTDKSITLGIQKQMEMQKKFNQVLNVKKTSPT